MRSYPSPGDATQRLIRTIIDELKRLKTRLSSVTQRVTVLEAGGGTGGSGSGTVTGVNAGDGISVDNSDPAEPIVAADVTLTVLASAIAGVSVSSEDVQDIVGGMFSGNTETGITATYDDTGGKIDVVTDVTTGDVPTIEEIQDIVGDMFTANVETGITAIYDDTDGTIDLVTDVTQAEVDAKAPLVATVSTGLATSGTVNLDLDALTGTVQWITATGNITFTTSNLSAGEEVRIFVDAGGSPRTMVYPAWIAHGIALPTTLPAGKRLALSILSLSTTDANVSALGSVQP